MKKLILPFLALLSMAAEAQYAPGFPVTNETNNLEISDVGGYTPSKITLGSDKKTRGPARWYDIVDAINESFQGAINVYSNDSYNTLWSDSTMLAPYGNNPVTYSDVWIRSVAAYFDPVDPRYNDPQFYGGESHIGSNDSYTIDSLFFPFIYYRNALKANVVDTLIVSVIYGDGSGVDEDLDIRYYGPTSSTAMNHSTDTLRVLHGFMDLDPNSSNQYGYLSSSPANVRTFRIPLTAASLNDTVTTSPGRGFNFVKVPVNLNVPAGNKAAACVVFKSGDTWTPLLDTLYVSGSRATPNFNNIRFVAFEETAGGYQEYTKGVWTQSGLMRTGNEPVWQNRHIPCYAFDNTSYEHQWFQWKATCNTCGSVGVNEVENALSNLSVYPNPTSGNVSVQFMAEQELTAASLTLLSLDGAVLYSVDLGKVSKGAELTEIVETKSLAAGVYFIQLTAAEGKQVEKVIVQ
jgi:hypothetical protein